MSDTDSQLEGVSQVTIVGTGLLGGSIGLGLRAAGYPGRLVGVGRRAITVQRAAELGCIDEPTTDLAQAVGGETSNLVVLATPLGAFEQLLSGLAKLSAPKAVITDVGSAKQQVCAAARRVLPVPAMFVGSHPMAGSELHGPEQATASLFRDKPCVIADEPGTDPNALAMVESLWQALGMRLIRMTAAEHDRQAAIVSHLPHAVAALLVEMAWRSDSLDMASTGFRDTTRIAGGNPNIWLDIFSTNRGALLQAIDALGDDLGKFRTLIENDDRAGLADLLTHSRDLRDRWDEAFHGHRTTKGD